jgi:hypothetical protein
MRKLIIALTVLVVGAVALVIKINYEQHKSDQEMEQQGKNMCQLKVVDC